MGRLTETDEKGNWRIGDCPWKLLSEGQIITKWMEEIIYSALCKLKDYEDSGLTPEQIYDMDKSFSHMCNIVNNKWIPVEQKHPENDDYILLSFDNFSIPMIGRYEETDDGGGAFYLGDCDEGDTCMVNNLFVNAWMTLPKPYRPEEDK